MIQEVETSKGSPAITSDRWHVVLSHFDATGGGQPFSRTIVSEHASRSACRKAAAELLASMDAALAAAPEPQRDQVFARPPNYKSLKAVRRRRAAE